MNYTFSGISTLILAASLTFFSCHSNAAPKDVVTVLHQDNDIPIDVIDDPTPTPSTTDNTRIQVAILLDTSNSMDGLIEQAKSRLWNIINTLTTLKYKGKTPQLEIALYEYGNDRLSAEKNYIRQVATLTTDLDLISEKLFSLTTNGGLEYCGAVIQDAVKKLEWGSKPADMKLVYIAGNEPFNQGGVNYKEAISEARNKGIYINTIYCGYREEGIRGLWKDGADKGQGKFFNIDSDRKVRFIETPYDARIDDCNRRLNDTYIGYGSMGDSKKEAQRIQDDNAKGLSSANYAERAVAKSKSAYKNTSWDLVDKVNEEGEAAIEQMPASSMPTEYKGKSKDEIKKLVAQQSKERQKIQKELEELAAKRQNYINDESKKSGENEDDLGNAITSSILTIAKANGYTQH